jgi:CubicO group peptidase (beta-lactamase class C family)
MKITTKKAIAIVIIALFIGTVVYPVSGKIGDNFSLFKERSEAANDLDFDKNITTLMKQAHIPGLSACIIRNDKVVWSKSYGYYNRLHFWKKPDLNTVYGLGCSTIAFTTTAIMQLCENGNISSLDDDVNNYLDFSLRNPYYPDVPITFRMLLTHKSGLSEYLLTRYKLFIEFAGITGFLKDPYHLLEDSLVPGGRYYKPSLWLNIKPGENASYSGIGFVVLACLVERISGETFDKYCKEHIFEPLEMYNTSFIATNLKRENLAVPYFPLFIKNFGVLIRLPWAYGRNPMEGSTGLFTTVNDLSHFLIAHMNNGTYNGKRILRNETVKLMHTIQIYRLGGPDWGNDYFWAYGFGWIFYNESGTIYQGAQGSNEWGSSSRMIFRASDNLGVVTLQSAWTPRALMWLIVLEIFRMADKFK